MHSLTIEEYPVDLLKIMFVKNMLYMNEKTHIVFSDDSCVLNS